MRGLAEQGAEQGTGHTAVVGELERHRLRWESLVIGTLAIAGLYLAGRHDYLLFHSLAEAFAVVIAAGIFMIAWNARAFLRNNYLLFLGIAYPFVGAIDLVHLLAYKGLGIFHDSAAANHATQFWVAARGVEAVSLLIAPLWLDGRRVPVHLLLAIYAVVTAALIGLIFDHRFPACFVEGEGLTGFKVGFEVAAILVLGGAALLLWRKRQRFDRLVLLLATASIVTTILSEAAFTFYHDPYGLLNQLGHVLKLVSFYLIYEATIANALRRPYSLLFRELKQSEEELRQKNRELDGYAHTVSHDLKNPLAGVIGAGQTLAKLLEQSPPPLDDVRKMGDIILRSGRKAVDLVNDLLALAEAGQRPSHVEGVRVSDVIARIVEERAPTIRERKVEVRVDPDLGEVRAAPAHVYQLFSNLIANALRHNRAAAPVIEVHRLDAGLGGHGFQVRDNGPGIPAEDLPLIFQPFFKGKTGGHGIGLSTVAKIVKLYGGRVQVRNDAGAVFELWLKDWAD